MSFFFFFLFLRLFIINWHVFFNWKGKVTKSANWRTKFTPGLCYKRLGHFPLLLDVLKMIFSSLWERGFFHSWITRHFVSKNLCVLIFVRLLFFIVKLCITFFCVLIYSHLEFSVLSCAVLPSLSQCVSSTIKFMCWVCNTFCYFFSYVNFVRLFIARNKRIYSLESCIFSAI